mmetsp:Transcript_24311/g.54109  ORF Transcript_24311/g.54109 Transcript_24311/m.54109 type:complete len:299 (-) Transcript_24311:3083-3979(-)
MYHMIARLRIILLNELAASWTLLCPRFPFPQLQAVIDVVHGAALSRMPGLLTPHAEVLHAVGAHHARHVLHLLRKVYVVGAEDAAHPIAVGGAVAEFVESGVLRLREDALRHLRVYVPLTPLVVHWALDGELRDIAKGRLEIPLHVLKTQGVSALELEDGQIAHIADHAGAPGQELIAEVVPFEVLLGVGWGGEVVQRPPSARRGAAGTGVEEVALECVHLDGVVDYGHEEEEGPDCARSDVVRKKGVLLLLLGLQALVVGKAQRAWEQLRDGGVAQIQLEVDLGGNGGVAPLVHPVQ